MTTSDRVADIPPLTGRTALVTGANSGLGFEVARVLAARDARVVRACRSQPRAEAAATAIRTETPSADWGTATSEPSAMPSVGQAGSAQSAPSKWRRASA